MPENTILKEELSSYIIVIAYSNVAHWDDFCVSYQEEITTAYDGTRLSTYKSHWLKRFRDAAKELEYSERDESGGKNRWSLISQKLKGKKSLSGHEETTSQSNSGISNSSVKCSSKSNYLVSQPEKEHVLSIFANSVYDHSFILDPSDTLWKSSNSKYFTKLELQEIETYQSKPLPAIPSTLQDYIDSFGTRPGMLLMEIQQSLLAVSKPFLHQPDIDFNALSEGDLLHRVWRFIYTLFDDNKIKARLGECSSTATSHGRNQDRTIEAAQKRQRKSMGAKTDIIFEDRRGELGACKVGKADVIPCDDEYLMTAW